MSDLVGCPEDRFCCDMAVLLVVRKVCVLIRSAFLKVSK